MHAFVLFALLSNSLAEAPSSRALLACAADLNGDGKVDGADLGILLGNWGKPGASDLNGDGTTDGADQAILMGQWGPCPTPQS
ncbi:MAG: hypothetical protein FJ257_05495 [Phycisphaerae bacterium]|nr:hypothetical protein [Phycisphaerae bacterium]